ncbi:MAG: hypothetical protein Q8Q23_05480 [bacterium]|nr:hypothetical protein [bacterium]
MFYIIKKYFVSTLIFLLLLAVGFIFASHNLILATTYIGGELGLTDIKPYQKYNELKIDQSGISWKIAGVKQNDYFIVWSKTKKPEYPTRESDKFYRYLGAVNINDVITAFDGAGIYYIRFYKDFRDNCAPNETDSVDDQVECELYSSEVTAYLDEYEQGCVDSDGGINLSEKGSLNNNYLTTGKAPVDYCLNYGTAGTLVEYACKDSSDIDKWGFGINLGKNYAGGGISWNYYSGSFVCPNGCSDGACIQATANDSSLDIDNSNNDVSESDIDTNQNTSSKTSSVHNQLVDCTDDASICTEDEVCMENPPDEGLYCCSIIWGCILQESLAALNDEIATSTDDNISSADDQENGDDESEDNLSEVDSPADEVEEDDPSFDNIHKFRIRNAELHRQLKGKIMLKVESAGEAYYIHPVTEAMYYLGRPNDAFGVMREQGVGITNTDLEKIPVGVGSLTGPDADSDGLPDLFEDAAGLDKDNPDTDNDGYTDKQELDSGYSPVVKFIKSEFDFNFGNIHKGKIFLQVEKKGEAWYINPNDGKRYFLGRPADAFKVMRDFGLGISNANFESIQQ